jgi:hypothetical protein
MSRQSLRQFLFLILAVALSACQSIVDSPDIARSGVDPQKRVDELQIVDCLLPGQMRILGSRSYMTPRRPTRTTASDCGIRGGEFIAYDRADYKTALSVWMPEAELGNAEAQSNVGEIFERGLGGEPNYAAAIIWYEKAADQGNKKAQFNLGTLYEQGLGVEKNMVAALDWYRLAWGLPKDELIFQSALDDELAVQKERLDKALARKDKQISLLERQIKSISKEAKQQSGVNSGLSSEIEELNLMIAELRTDRDLAKSESVKVDEKLRLRQPILKQSIARTRQPEGTQTVVERQLEMDMKQQDITPNHASFGRYFALVIGNQNYLNIENLMTPKNDADEIAELLENKYGFNVVRLNDSDNIAIMDAINNLNKMIGEEDNLLIYYAGHGNRVAVGDFETGYWLPSNADAPPRDTLWISNEFITRHIARIQAKRVLVIADSCYAGMLSSAPGHLLMKKVDRTSERYIQYKKPRRSRLLLASGGDRPVLDSGGGNNSVFANALIQVLKNNNGLITGPEVFESVRQKVISDAKAADFEQTPQYKVIKGAGHEMGDFFFIPNTQTKS